MKDIQSLKDSRNIPLKNVGVKSLKWPITVMDKGEGIQHTVGEFMLSVDLPHDVRGTHMSRFVESLGRLEALSPKNIEKMLEELRENLKAETARCKISFDYFIKKPSPVTGIIAPYDIKCSFEGEKSNDFRFIMEVSVPVSTLCPCSKEISDFGAHNQRALITIRVEMDRLVWIEDIVKIAEESASTPVFSLLKRKDEKWVTEQAYLNPRFVEDVTREAAVRLEELEGVIWYSVSAESIESIHNHNAFAQAERGMRG